jgi:hypothetical protein
MQNISRGESVSGFRGLLLKKYDEYRKQTKVILVTASYSLPYKNNYTEPYFVLYHKIHSEELKDVWYDVVIQYITDNKITPDTQIRIYSNSPQFTFTYAYCYNREGDLLFPHLYPKIVLSDYPKEKNPLCLKGLDKHVYVALKEATAKRITYDTVSKLNKNDWTPIMDIESFNKKIKFAKKRR